MLDSPLKNDGPPSKGKEKACSNEGDTLDITPTTCHLLSLPTELINSILLLLSPADIVSVGAACRWLHEHAESDHIWQAVVQEHVPGVKLSSPSPCDSFKRLFAAHDPRWFLPKYKIWFSDRDLTGRLIVARYNPRRGSIEGYQLVAISNRNTFEPWQADHEVIIHGFEPSVKLHLDKPILQLDADSLENTVRSKLGAPTTMAIRTTHSEQESSELQSVPETEPISVSPRRAFLDARDPLHPESSTGPHRFRVETPMVLGLNDSMFSNFILAKSVTPGPPGILRPFPFGEYWPPQTVPALQRVCGFAAQTMFGTKIPDAERPNRREEISDRAFRIRSWLEMRGARAGGNDDRQVGRPDLNNSRAGMHMGEVVTTYATLEPHLYTPTADKPYRGIWVGDYSSHGCEFLLIHQPDDPDDTFDPESVVQRNSETQEEFEKRKRDERVYRGRLEAIKLTGDPNVPRGEFTFVADDIGEAGFLAEVQEPPFAGARVVKSKGHVAQTGFIRDKYVDSQLILVSHDRLAQYWVGFGHISFFERLDIDQFLDPQ